MDDSLERQARTRGGLAFGNCGMGSANKGLYDVLNNEESESLSGVVHQTMMMEIGEKGVSGETERRDGHRDPGPDGALLPLTV